MASHKPAAWVFLLTIAVGAFALRFAQLDRRPMHHDEANQAVRTGVLQETGKYEYSLHEHHGPALYYLALPLARLTSGQDFAGTTETTFRLVPVVFGVMLILFMGLLGEGMGWGSILCGAVLSAISPCLMYYNRFFIQESLLVFFTFGAIATGWWHVRTQETGWALLAGAFLGLMYSTKETCVIAYAAMLAGIVVVHRHHDEPWPIRIRHMAGGAAMAGAFAFVLFCSFFTNPKGPLDSLRSFLVYLDRAGGAGQAHPWYYYLQTLTFVRSAGGLVWSEGLIVALALVGAVAAWVRRDFGRLDGRLIRFLTVYTTVMTLTYSLIPYKTPWCMLSFLHGMILLAGFGAVSLVQFAPKLWMKLLTGAVLVVATGQLGWQMWRANFRYDADSRNPYAYVQTSRDFLKLVQRIENVAGRDDLIAVITNEYDAWPLPWYLRKFRQVGYWSNASGLPSEAKPAVIVTSMDKQQPFGGYQSEFYGLRPNVLLELHIREDLWTKFLERQGQLSSSSRR